MPLAILLGNAQDAGVPQAGCSCETCRLAWADPAQRKLASALALADPATGQWWLVDATPDFRPQLHYMQATFPALRLAGILITHAHLGHYTGLLHLGLEAMAAPGVPVFGTGRLLDFLSHNGPWRQLVDQGHVLLRQLEPGAWLDLSDDLSVQPLPVPHRAEWSDTVAYLARGPRRRLLYLPDIDSWTAWAQPPYALDVRAVVDGVDVALLDGTFYSPNELPGRDQAAIAHPLVTDTAARLAGTRAAVYFIHLNHSNPLLRPGPERQWLAAQGFRAAEAGEQWEL